MTVRVVPADDHPMYRFGLRAVLDASSEVEVIGEAADGAELLALVAAVRRTPCSRSCWPPTARRPSPARETGLGRAQPF